MASILNTLSLVLGIVLVINSTLAAYDHAKAKERSAQIISECKAEVKATDDDIKTLMAKKLPETHEGWCLIECLYAKVNIMKDGKFNKDGTIQATSPVYEGDADKLGKLKTMMEECDKEIGAGDADKCLTAKQVAQCIGAKGKEFGFKYPGQD